MHSLAGGARHCAPITVLPLVHVGTLRRLPAGRRRAPAGRNEMHPPAGSLLNKDPPHRPQPARPSEAPIVPRLCLGGVLAGNSA